MIFAVLTEGRFLRLACLDRLKRFPAAVGLFQLLLKRFQLFLYLGDGGRVFLVQGGIAELLVQLFQLRFHFLKP